MTRLQFAKVATRRPTLDEMRQWPATCGIGDACRALGISRSHGYSLMSQGAFPAKVLLVGSCHRVVTASLIRLLDADDTAA